MANKEAPKKEEAAAGDAPPKKSKKLLFIIIGVAVLTLGLGVGLGIMLGGKKAPADGEHEEAKAEKHEEKKKEEHKPPVFLPLEPFTVNLQPETPGAGEQFLQMAVSLKVSDDKKAEELKALMPQIRHEILNLAGAQKASEITSPEGKESLAADIQDVMNEVMGVEPPKRSKRRKKDAEEHEVELPVQAVFFTQFIVQ
ncbi:flagellar basal body-associated FliL family protein [Viridibacterium curvum]|uniref:Flagellar protein FliL n=1 Tax=Viridibacterium curvum TaxID=1101404 RepID=A0ABP9QD38_9RHOO